MSLNRDVVHEGLWWLINSVSEGEDALISVDHDARTSTVTARTALGFDFAVNGHRLHRRMVCAGDPTLALLEAIEEAYEARVRAWLREGPWL